MKRSTQTLIALIAITGAAQAQTVPSVTVTVTPTVADGKAVPVVTWSSSPIGATSCTASGGWSGTKSGAGTQTLPQVTANASFTLTCAWPNTTGSAVVDWTPPVQNTDNSPLTNLAGYDVVAGTDPAALAMTTNVPDPAARSKTVTGLSAGTWYFAVRACNTNNVCSGLSNISQPKVITVPANVASATATLTIRPVPNPPVLQTVSVVAGVKYVPVFRIAANGVSISSTLYGMIPTGRTCGAKVAKWRGVSINHVTVSAEEVWPKGTSTQGLAAPCG